jgi:multidrug efflux pump subunit AcrA (membrane-fusion protein)
MRKEISLSLLCLITMTGNGCVMKSTYNEVLADLEGTKAELDSARTQSRMLTQEAAELEQLRGDLARQFEAATAALQQAKLDIETEQAASQRQLHQLTQKLNQLTAQQNSLRLALQRAQDERPALQSTIDKFKTKLGDVDGPRVPSFSSFPPPSVTPTNESAQTLTTPQAQTQASTNPAPVPTTTPRSAPTDQPPGKAKPPTPQNQEAADNGILSAIKGWVLSLWRSIFS